MNDQQLFRRTRWRLAYWYAGVMGIILGVSGLGAYEAIDHAHRMAADRELQSIAGQIHDTLEPQLQTQDLPEAVLNRLPNACAIAQCPKATQPNHAPGEMFQGSYYVRLIDATGELVALAGFQPQSLPETDTALSWTNLRDAQNQRYRQITIPLHQIDAQLWGYLQVGSSLQDSDEYLAAVRLTFGIGLPLALLFVGGASWWLAGLAMRPIYQSYQQMQQFTADAAHELRTPIAAAQATVESVLDSLDGSTQETFQILDRQHRRLSSLVQDLLLLTRLDRQAETGVSRCCLQDIVNDVSEELAALALTQQLKFQTRIEVEHPLWVYGNEEQLYRLVFNLVINAFQYTPTEGSITLTLGLHEEKAFMRVSDTGIGIAPEFQTKIFDRFFRINRDRSRKSGGSGLGLAIAQAIAQKHKGRIQIQSKLGQGSTFTVYLPQAFFGRAGS